MGKSQNTDTVASPYKENSLNIFYNMLFCDNIELYSTGKSTPVYPWNILLSEKNNHDELIKIINDSNVESRCKIISYKKLLKTGYEVEKKILLGVIVEVGMEEGLDVLAAYKDGTARYINYSGKSIIWETSDEQSEKLTTDLFSHGEYILGYIGPWTEQRPEFPGKGYVRISFLVSDGFYFGQGLYDAFFKDKLAEPALNSAAELMGYLISKATDTNKSV